MTDIERISIEQLKRIEAAISPGLSPPNEDASLGTITALLAAFCSASLGFHGIDFNPVEATEMQQRVLDAAFNWIDEYARRN
jgi:hypothetical protein